MSSEKIYLRQYIRTLKHQYSDTQLCMMSQEIMSRLLEEERIKRARTILLYHSLADEVNTHRLVDFLAKDKTILLPKVVSADTMTLHIYHDSQDLQIGAYGIMEPTGPLFTKYDSIDVAVIPGMAFDRDNNRLGRGKGYYDRLLIQIPNTYKIGLCFDFQYLDKIPSDIYDVKMDKVLH
jgi:5-formyltetrahydrofolate cyclo-ligase